MDNTEPMTAKEYLSQVYQIDRRITDLLEQAEALRELVTRVTPVLSDIPRSATADPHRMEASIVKMLDLEHEITAQIDRLVDLKREIMGLLQRLPTEYQSLLEQRYLLFKTWGQMAALLGYGERHVYKLHAQALAEFKKIYDSEKMALNGSVDLCFN